MQNSVGSLLAGAGIEPREARQLLAHASGVAEAILAAFPERNIESAAAGCFRDWVSQRRAGAPMAYVLGRREFYGRAFEVSPAVLIPRPDTELLVDCALEYMRADARVLDLGTGSGAIAITLACEQPLAIITAIDRSAAALDVAQRNAHTHAPGRIDFVQSDWFARVTGREFDLIVGNPPYIAAADPHLEHGDLRFEPSGALVGGVSGMECIESIAAAAAAYLRRDGWLLLEHGFDQGESTRKTLTAAGFAEVRTWRDLAGHERVTGGKNADRTAVAFEVT
jgi:release factor glutamine methyltransferase